MTHNIKWLGPFGWPKFEGDLPPVPDVTGGVYLQTYGGENGYFVDCAGYTTRTLQKRLREHTHLIMRGTYSILDVAAMQRGVRKEIWRGFWNWAGEEPSRKDQAEYHKRQTKIQYAARKQLEGLRVFVASLGKERRFLARVESAIMRSLEEQPAPFCNTRWEDMTLSRRWKSERPITIHNKCPVKIHGLPSRLII